VAIKLEILFDEVKFSLQMKNFNPRQDFIFMTNLFFSRAKKNDFGHLCVCFLIFPLKVEAQIPNNIRRDECIH